LLERMQRVGLRPPEEIRSIGQAIAGALEEAHSLGILHRDVKPENVMLRQDGTPLLCDFGVARSEQGDAVQTAEGIILGTLEYMAPELMLGEPPSSATDAFALAATLYFLRFGEPPYPGSDPGALARIAQGTRGPSPPEPVAKDEALDQILLRAVAPRPDQRLPDLSTFRAALGGEDMGRVGDTVVLTASSPDIVGMDTAPIGRPRAPRRRRLVPLVVGGVGMLALMATGAWWLAGGPATNGTSPKAALPTSAPTRDPVPEEVRQAWLRFAGFRQGPRGDFEPKAGTDGYRAEHSDRIHAQILDLRFDMRATRFFKALRGWIEKGQEEDLHAPATRDFLVQVVEVLKWIVADMAQVALPEGLGFQTLQSDGEGIMGTFRKMDKAIEYARPFTHLASEINETMTVVDARGGPPSGHLLHALAVTRYEHPLVETLNEKLWEVYRGTEDPVLAADLLAWIAETLSERNDPTPNCEWLRPQLEELLDLGSAPGHLPGRELWVQQGLLRAATVFVGQCKRAAPLDPDRFLPLLRATENAPLQRVRSLEEVGVKLGLLEGALGGTSLAGSPVMTAAIPVWLQRRTTLQPVLELHEDAFALPAGADPIGTADALDTAEANLLEGATPERIRALALALVHWVELQRRMAPEELVQEASRLRIQGALEAAFDELAAATPETAQWVDGAVARLATVVPPAMDSCLAQTLRHMARRRGLPDLPWLPGGPCYE
jgi:hypothetical protein